MNLWASWQDLKVVKQHEQPPLTGQDKGQSWEETLLGVLFLHKMEICEI